MFTAYDRWIVHVRKGPNSSFLISIITHRLLPHLFDDKFETSEQLRPLKIKVRKQFTSLPAGMHCDVNNNGDVHANEVSINCIQVEITYENVMLLTPK